MSQRPDFPSYDPKIADAMIEGNRGAQGLPGYLGADFVEFAPGSLRARMPIRQEFLTPFGNIHGGVMAAFVDHVLGCVVYPLMEKGSWAATTEFKLNYLAPVREGELVADATVVSFTKRTAVVRVDVANGDRLACVAQGTLLIVAPKKK